MPENLAFSVAGARKSASILSDMLGWGYSVIEAFLNVLAIVATRNRDAGFCMAVIQVDISRYIKAVRQQSVYP